MKYLTIKQYATLSGYSVRRIEHFVQNGEIETTVYLGQKGIDVEKHPIPAKKKSSGRKLGTKNKKGSPTDEEKKERNRLGVARFREKNNKKS